MDFTYKKFDLQGSSEGNRRMLSMAGASSSGSKAHPSLAKLRDNLINGTIDFAEVPIIDMNPEDIRVCLLVIQKWGGGIFLAVKIRISIFLTIKI